MPSSVENSVKIISTSRVFPDKKPTLMNLKLSVSDLRVLSCDYIQKGCIFTRPHLPPDALLSHFKQTLSLTLSHFPLLARRLSTSDDGYVFLSGNDAGADYVFADAKPVHVSDVIAGINVPDVVKEFVSCDRAVSYEGHTRPILAVQVTELIDGVYIVCSLNSAVTDDMLWNFINTFAEMSGVEILTRPAEVLPPPPPPLPPPPSLLPQRQPSNPFLNVAPPHPMNLTNNVPEPHQMDTLSWTALAYCFTAGLEFNSIFAQVGNPNNVSFRVQLLSVLFYIALYLLIVANGIFAKTHPRMAFMMDRLGSVIVLISSTIAATPTISEYVSIGCAVVMIIVYTHQYFKKM